MCKIRTAHGVIENDVTSLMWSWRHYDNVINPKPKFFKKVLVNTALAR